MPELFRHFFILTRLRKTDLRNPIGLKTGQLFNCDSCSFTGKAKNYSCNMHAYSGAKEQPIEAARHKLSGKGKHKLIPA